ncbi:MAG: hypothetical protein Q4G59_01240 [Planctomycetia bacterium]|nr:hypothetical protein [Planctomycetia bacterium]
MILKPNITLLGRILVLVVFLTMQSGCSCRPEPIPEETSGAATSQKVAQPEEKSKSPARDAKTVAREGQYDTAQGGLSQDSKGTSDGSGSGNTSSGSASGDPENIFEQGTKPAGSSNASSGTLGGKGSGSGTGSGSGKGRKSRFSVGTVLSAGAGDVSKGTSLSAEELTTKAKEALEEARNMVKKKKWGEGYQSAAVCYEFLTRLPAEAENAESNGIREECTRLLKSCSSHLDTNLPTGNDKAIVIE